MTTESPKKRTPRPLSAMQCAEKVHSVYAALPSNIAAAVKKAEQEERDAARDKAAAYVKLMPGSELDLFNKLLLTLGTPLNGIELQPSNDSAQPAAPEEIAASEHGPLGPSGPVVPTERIERDAGGARRVGPGRG
jgi:hypothetical protein